MKSIKKINNLSNFKQFYNFKYDGFDIGMMIISNFCRIHKVGLLIIIQGFKNLFYEKQLLNLFQNMK